MKCKDIEKLIYLNRPGELSVNEQKKREEHLSKCTYCAELKINIENYNGINASLQNNRPLINDPEILSDRVMENIKPANVNYSNIGRSIDIFASWFYKPIIKYSFMLVLLLMLGSLFVQQIKITYSISKLESQVTNYSPAQKIKLSGLFKKIKQTNFKKSNKSLYNNTLLFSLRKNIRNLGINSRIVFYNAIYTIPELNNLSSRKEFKDAEFLKLLEKKNEILQKMNNLLTKRRIIK